MATARDWLIALFMSRMYAESLSTPSGYFGRVRADLGRDNDGVAAGARGSGAADSVPHSDDEREADDVGAEESRSDSGWGGARRVERFDVVLRLVAAGDAVGRDAAGDERVGGV